MDESPFLTALERLRDSIHSRNDEAFAEILTELDTKFDTVGGPWPEGFFDGLEKLLNEPNFLNLTNSWKLLYFIKNNWKQLSDEDRSRLKGLIVDKFDRHADWMGAFLSSEILGEHYADESTLATFAHLGKAAQFPARELVPHGIEYLAKSTKDESLRMKAVCQLRELKENGSEAIRKKLSSRCESWALKRIDDVAKRREALGVDRKRLLYCVNVNRTSLDHLLLGKCADSDKMSHAPSIHVGARQYEQTWLLQLDAVQISFAVLDCRIICRNFRL